MIYRVITGYHYWRQAEDFPEFPQVASTAFVHKTKEHKIQKLKNHTTAARIPALYIYTAAAGPTLATKNSKTSRPWLVHTFTVAPAKFGLVCSRKPVTPTDQCKNSYLPWNMSQPENGQFPWILFILENPPTRDLIIIHVGPISISTLEQFFYLIILCTITSAGKIQNRWRMRDQRFGAHVILLTFPSRSWAWRTWRGS